MNNEELQEKEIFEVVEDEDLDIGLEQEDIDTGEDIDTDEDIEIEEVGDPDDKKE